MKVLILVIAALLEPVIGLSQADYKVYTSHPRLWLEEQRLSRLRKDVERQSDRWQTLRRLIDQDATFPEEPLVLALRYQAAGDEISGRHAIDWALTKTAGGRAFSTAAGIRLGAIVFDWCHRLLGDQERRRLATHLGEAARALARRERLSLAEARSALMALVAVAGDWEASARVSQTMMDRHWKASVLGPVRRGEPFSDPHQRLALAELSHVMRYNFEIDPWRATPEFFETLPLISLLQYGPAPAETSQGRFRLPGEARFANWSDQDAVRVGTLSRLADMVFVAYESNLAGYQFLQGWLRHDAYALTSAWGAPYEFLWVNPYLPGLSYFSAPAVVHDELRGRLYGRSGWLDSDMWAGYFDGNLHILADGESHIIGPDAEQKPLVFHRAAIAIGRVPFSFQVEIPEGEVIFVAGLEEGQTYRVRINRTKEVETQAGRGGILVLRNDVRSQRPEIDFSQKTRVRVRPAKKR